MNKESFMQNPLENNGGVLAIEFFDANALDISRSSNAWRIPADARAAIQVQFFGDDWEAAHTINGLLQRYDSNYVGIIPSDLASAFRTSTPGTVAESLKRLGLTKLGTDFAVSPDHFPELFEVYRSIRQECSECFTTPAGLPTSATWGHIGDCNLHMNLFPNSPSEAQFAEELYGRAVEKVLALGGTVTAEHGTGKKAVYAFGEKKHYLEHMLGREGLKEIAAVKNVFDPQGILNPGNLGFTYGQ
jgi:D-lactate dehydrogenase (cytochrome)